MAPLSLQGRPRLHGRPCNRCHPRQLGVLHDGEHGPSPRPHLHRVVLLSIGLKRLPLAPSLPATGTPTSRIAGELAGHALSGGVGGGGGGAWPPSHALPAA